jgi:phospholipid transport system substrate-binding protein
MIFRKLIYILLVLFAVCFAELAMAQNSPTDEVKKVVDEVVSIVSSQDMKKPENKEKRKKGLKVVVGAIFDYKEMAKLSLGRYWDERTTDEKSEFVQVFETLLENTYTKKIESYNNEKVVYLKETVDGNSSEVKSKVVTSKHDEYAIDYRLFNKGGKWVIHDVSIEGISLVANYRTQFDKIIRSEGYTALIKKLNSKRKDIAAQ